MRCNVDTVSRTCTCALVKDIGEEGPWKDIPVRRYTFSWVHGTAHLNRPGQRGAFEQHRNTGSKSARSTAVRPRQRACSLERRQPLWGAQALYQWDR